MASKCKRPKLLPDPCQLLQQRKEEMNTIKAVNGSIHTLKSSNLFLLGETAQQHVPEATKVVWLVTKYGFKMVNSLCQAMKAIPTVLTRQQRLAHISTCVNLLGCICVKCMFIVHLLFIFFQISYIILC